MNIKTLEQIIKNKSSKIEFAIVTNLKNGESQVLEPGQKLSGDIDKVQKEAQERQATLVEEMAPEAQPGLAMPGVGAESPVAPPPMEREPSIDELMAAL